MCHCYELLSVISVTLSIFFGSSFVFQCNLHASWWGCITYHSLYLVVFCCTSCFILKAPASCSFCVFTHPAPLPDLMRMMNCTCSSSTCLHSSVYVSVFALPVGFFSTCEWCYVFFHSFFPLFCWFAPFQTSLRPDAFITLFLCVFGKTHKSPGIVVLDLGKLNHYEIIYVFVN